MESFNPGIYTSCLYINLEIHTATVGDNLWTSVEISEGDILFKNLGSKV